MPTRDSVPSVLMQKTKYTPLAGSLLNTEEKRLANAQRHPLKRIGTAEDISNLACFLLSDKSTWMTGQILHLDGGMSVLK